MGTHPIFESDFDCLTDRFGQKNMSLVSPDKFQHILRVQNTNIDGCRNIMFAMTAIRGIGRRFSNLICKMLILTCQSVPVSWTRTKSVVWRLSCSTQDNTRSPIGSSTDKRTGRTVPLANLSPTVLT